MFKIDLIIPPYYASSKLPFLSYKGDVDWFPLWYNNKNLKKEGIKIRFINYPSIKYDKLFNTVVIDSRIFDDILLKKNISKYEEYHNKIISFLENLRKKVDCVLWFDNTDSSGTPQFMVLPWVDRYFKKQLLKDLSLYKSNYYTDRFHIDYYVKNYNLEKTKEDIKGLDAIKLDMKYKKIITLSWNCSLWDYRYSNYKFLRVLNLYSRILKLKFVPPYKERKILFSANFSYKSSNLFSFQRKELLKYLTRKFKNNQNISLGYVPYKIFLKNLRTSKAIFSPFLYGEICRSDFETFIFGSALIKPNMDHIITWPNIYIKNKTYIPISWKVEEWEIQIPKILEDQELLVDIATTGQDRYKKLWTKKGQSKFCQHFINMVRFN